MSVGWVSSAFLLVLDFHMQPAPAFASSRLPSLPKRSSSFSLSLLSFPPLLSSLPLFQVTAFTEIATAHHLDKRGSLSCRHSLAPGSVSLDPHKFIMVHPL
jgi:hypothetical protein